MATPFTLQNVETIQMTDSTTSVTGASITSVGGGVSVSGYIVATGGVSAGTLQINSLSIDDTTGGKIAFGTSFGTTDVTTTGSSIIISSGADRLQLYQGTITDTSGSISFNNTSLTTNATGTFGGTLVLDSATITDTGPTDIAITPGVLTDKLDAFSGTIDIGTAGVVTFANGSYQFPTTAPTTGQTFVAGAGGVLTFGTAGGGSGASSISSLSDAYADTTNVVLGNEATSLTSGSDNVGVGVSALFDITSGSRNVAIGSTALTVGTTVSDSIAIGYNSLVSTTTGPNSRNIAIGTSTLSSITGGIGGNVAIGYLAGTSLTSSQNTIIGASAGMLITSGNQNVIIGCCAAPSLTSGSNNIVIGYDTEVASGPTTSHNVYLGNSSIQSLFLAGTVFQTSDRRDKTDIEDSSFGLDFIENLRPVEYTWDRRVLNSGDKNCSMNGKRRVGLIAQEVLETMPNEENEILDLVKEENPERYHIGYNNLIPVLVKAVKDLKSEVDTLKQRMDNCSC